MVAAPVEAGRDGLRSRRWAAVTCPTVRSTLARGWTSRARRALGDELVAHVRRRRDNWWWQERGGRAGGGRGGHAEHRRRRRRRCSAGASVCCADADAELVVAGRAGSAGCPGWPTLAYRLADRLPRDRAWDGWRFVAELLLAEKAPPPTGDAVRASAGSPSMGWPAAEGQRPVAAGRPAARGPVPGRAGAAPVRGGRRRARELAFDAACGRGVAPRALARAGGGGPAGPGGAARRRAGPAAARRPAGRVAPVPRPARPAEPTPDEVAARSSDYLRLLADGPGRWPAIAQRTLREARRRRGARGVAGRLADGAGPTGEGAGPGAAAWLDQLARQHPERAAEIADVARRRLPTTRPPTCATARRRWRRGTAPAGRPTVAVGAAGDDLPPPCRPAPAPPPITDVDELVEEVAVPCSAAGRRRSSGTGPRRAGPAGQLPTGTGSRPPCCRCCGGPRWCRRTTPWDPVQPVRSSSTGCCWPRADPVGAATPPRRVGLAVLTAMRPVPGRRPSSRSTGPAPHAALRARLAEIGQRLGRPRRPRAVGRPDLGHRGHRPGRCSTNGWPRSATAPYWRVGLTQALLRLPPASTSHWRPGRGARHAGR